MDICDLQHHTTLQYVSKIVAEFGWSSKRLKKHDVDQDCVTADEEVSLFQRIANHWALCNLFVMDETKVDVLAIPSTGFALSGLPGIVNTLNKREQYVYTLVLCVGVRGIVDFMLIPHHPKQSSRNPQPCPLQELYPGCPCSCTSKGVRGMHSAAFIFFVGCLKQKMAHGSALILDQLNSHYGKQPKSQLIASNITPLYTPCKQAHRLSPLDNDLFAVIKHHLQLISIEEGLTTTKATHKGVRNLVQQAIKALSMLCLHAMQSVATLDASAMAITRPNYSLVSAIPASPVLNHLYTMITWADWIAVTLTSSSWRESGRGGLLMPSTKPTTKRESSPSQPGIPPSLFEFHGHGGQQHQGRTG